MIRLSAYSRVLYPSPFPMAKTGDGSDDEAGCAEVVALLCSKS
jgi:hypothetical protein